MVILSKFVAPMKNKKFIDVAGLIASKNPKLAKRLPKFIIKYLERILHQDEINEFIIENGHLYDHEFCSAIINYFNITIKIEGIENIPVEGPAIVTMNHPLGGMDAIAFVHSLKDHRKDIRFIVNDLLLSLENLKNLFVGVNKHGKNRTETRKDIENLFHSDHLVCIFPAGMVSRRKKGMIRDLEWKKTFVGYAKKLQTPVIPVFIDGELSNFFYNLSNLRSSLGIKSNLEMLYLSNELFKQRNRTMIFKIGKAIQLPENETNEIELANLIKSKVYELEKNN